MGDISSGHAPSCCLEAMYKESVLLHLGLERIAIMGYEGQLNNLDNDLMLDGVEVGGVACLVWWEEG